MIETFIKKNPALLRLYKNAGILFAGNLSGSVINFLALAIITRALGLEMFGVFALLTAYISLIDRLVSFQTWQALIHFGTKSLHDNNHENLSSLFAFGWGLDLFSSTLGFCLSFLGLVYLPHVFGLESVDRHIFLITASVLLLNWISTPTALLRLYDKFIYQAVFANVSAVLRFTGYLFFFLLGYESLLPFISIWALSLIISRLYLFLMAIRVGRQNNLFTKGSIKIVKMVSETPKLLSFVFITNLDGIVRVVRDLDIFVVNMFLGMSGAGLYKLAREIARIPTQFTGPFYQAIYPDLSKFITNKEFKHFLNLMKQSSLTLGLIMVCGLIGYVFIGELFIKLFFGAEYVDAFWVTFWCLGSAVIWAFAQPLSPAMMSLGEVRTMLSIHAITTFTYLALLWFTASIFGLTGAGIALCIFYAIWSGTTYIFFMKHIKTAQKNED